MTPHVDGSPDGELGKQQALAAVGDQLAATRTRTTAHRIRGAAERVPESVTFSLREIAVRGRK